MKIKFISTLFAIVLLSTSCEKDATNSLENTAIKSYSEIVFATYEDSYTEAVKLQTAIKIFITTPTSGTFELAKAAWKSARIPYGQTEAFRFYGGPIDNDEGPEGLINGWPMDESFLDYVEGNLTAGLINNPTKYPAITKELLESLNEKESETQIMTGYHAIEFLLWGTRPKRQRPRPKSVYRLFNRQKCRPPKSIPSSGGRLISGKFGTSKRRMANRWQIP